jgi:hypothetical protein
MLIINSNYDNQTDLGYLLGEVKDWNAANLHNRKAHIANLLDNDVKQAMNCLDSALRGERIVAIIQARINALNNKHA